uniref:Uncharacterized protein n=1 Tax=Romanomermis culicivorax TaxID=13658 RepID=A0A915HZV8_ROMCU
MSARTGIYFLLSLISITTARSSSIATDSIETTDSESDASLTSTADPNFGTTTEQVGPTTEPVFDTTSSHSRRQIKESVFRSLWMKGQIF